MMFAAGILIGLLALPAFASEKLTTVTIDGTSYSHIQDVHIVSGGRIVILYGRGRDNGDARQTASQKFLDSWGIMTEALAESKASAKDAGKSRWPNWPFARGFSGRLAEWFMICASHRRAGDIFPRSRSSSHRWRRAGGP